MNKWTQSAPDISKDWLMSRTWSPNAICPDLSCFEQIGEADRWRGRIVRAFFWLMRIWPA